MLGDHFVGAGYGVAAVAGTPSITVPMGDVRGLPIGLAFMIRSSVSGGIVALYPSPAGATESELDKQGRVMIPASLIAHAKLGKEVVIAGVNDIYQGRTAESVERELEIVRRGSFRCQVLQLAFDEAGVDRAFGQTGHGHDGLEDRPG